MTDVVDHTPAGTVRARVRKSGARIEAVAYVNVPCFVLHAGLPVKIDSRVIRADVVFGGAFYAIVDCEAVGIPIDLNHLPQLRQAGMKIKRVIEESQTIVHPLKPASRASTAPSSPVRRTWPTRTSAM